MTEAEWLACTDPQKMLEFLGTKSTARKRRLFACACCRRIWSHLTDERSRQAIDTSERFADGLATKEELARASNAAWAASHDRRVLAEWAGSENWPYAGHFDYAVHLTAALNPYLAAILSEANGGKSKDDWKAAAREQSFLLRDLFGNAFRQISVDPTWLSWKDGTIPKLAQAIYDDRAFDRMPELADALEEAGCTNADILNHCRKPGERVRDCWVIDLILGKE